MHIQKNVCRNSTTNPHMLQLLLFFVETVTLKIMCRIQKMNKKSQKNQLLGKIFKRKTYYYTEFPKRRRKEFQDK